MKREPEVSYKGFKLSRINEPQYKHLWLLSAWIFYFAAYLITERFIPYDDCAVMHCFIDDLIPFCEWFVIPYVGWYLLVAGSLWHFMHYNVDSFKNLMKFIIITQVVAMAVYIIFPNRQDLRPEHFERDNILTRLVGLLYAADTSTNVCPSLHVGYSIGIASVWLKDKRESVGMKIFIVISVIIICLATMFIKQHSAVDVIAACVMCVFAEFIVYGIPKLRHKKDEG